MTIIPPQHTPTGASSADPPSRLSPAVNMDPKATVLFFMFATSLAIASPSFGGKEHVHIRVHVPHIINELHHEKKVVLVHHQPHQEHHHHEHITYEGHDGGYDGYLKGGHSGPGASIVEYGSSGYGGSAFGSYGHGPSHYVSGYGDDHHHHHH